MGEIAKGLIGGFFRASLSSYNTYTVENRFTVDEMRESTHDEVASYPIFRRDDHVIFHGPIKPGFFQQATGLTKAIIWNIIAHHPSNGKLFSLYRSDDKAEAEQTFNSYRGVISVLIKNEPLLCEKLTLEKMCQKLRVPSNEGWSAAHLAAALDFHKAFKHAEIKKFINDQEGSLLQTPIQIAILHKSTAAVTELLNMNVHLDLKDLEQDNVVHLAARSSPLILKVILDRIPERYSLMINETNKKGMTPLGIACEASQAENVKLLLNAGCDVNFNSGTSGFPIHIAVKNNSQTLIQELVSRSSSQLNIKDPVSGNSPLHFAKGAETVLMLLEMGSDPNISNDLGETALHYAARRGCLKSTLHLLCHEAFADFKDINGETPLMVAARLCSRLIIQALVAFDADINSVNNRGESARHLICTSGRSDKDQILFYLDSVGAKRCPASLQYHCVEGCKFSESFRGIPPEGYLSNAKCSLVHQALFALSSEREVLSGVRKRTNSTSSSSRPSSLFIESSVGGRLLCLDGGGIRGIILTQILLYLERELGVPVLEVFDWICGTSTGGILALALASGKSVREVQALYFKLKDKVFSGERPYSSELMEEFMKKELGSETRMSELLRPRLMVTTAIADSRPADFHFFRNYISPSVLMSEKDACERQPEEVYVWEVAKATGAAPSYFKLDGKYIDGGLVANNPTLDALTELTQYAAVMRAIGESSEQNVRIPTVVVSLGTGIQPRVQASSAHYDIARPNGILDTINFMRQVPKIGSIIALLVEQTTQTEGQIVERSRAWCASIGVPFFRFSPRLSSFIDLDEINDEILVNLMWETRSYLYEQHGAIIELKRNLFAHGSPVPNAQTQDEMQLN